MIDFLSRLPVECVDHIWSLLERPDWLVAMRVSAAWRLSVEPVFYRHIDIRSPSSLLAAQRTIENRPELAPFFQRLSVHHRVSTAPDVDTDHITAVTTQLLCQLPRLNTLHFYRWPFGMSVLGAAIQRLGGRGFPELREVLSEAAKIPMNQLRPLWMLPAIERIETAVTELDILPDNWPTAKTLTKLNLGRTTLGEQHVRVLLQASPGLKSFTYDLWCNVGDQMPTLDCKALNGALDYVKETLQELDLGVTLYSPYAEQVEDYDIIPVKGRIGSLQGFTCLYKLRLPLSTLLGWFPAQAPSMTEMLPSSLSHLCLTEDLSLQSTYEWEEEGLVLKLLRSFFATARQATPLLRIFEFVPDRTLERWGPSVEEQLYTMCSDAGIECLIREEEL